MEIWGTLFTDAHAVGITARLIPGIGEFVIVQQSPARPDLWDEFQRGAQAEAELALDAMAIPHRLVEVPDTSDFLSVYDALGTAYAAGPARTNTPVEFVIAEGPAPLIGAALIFALTRGIAVRFYRAATQMLQPFNVHGIRQIPDLPPAKKKILRACIQTPAGVSFSAIGRLLDVSPGAVTQHIQPMVRSGLVRIEKIPRSEGRGKRLVIEPFAAVVTQHDALIEKAAKGP